MCGVCTETMSTTYIAELLVAIGCVVVFELGWELRAPERVNQQLLSRRSTSTTMGPPQDRDVVMGPPLPPLPTSTQPSVPPPTKDNQEVAEKYRKLKRRYFELEEVGQTLTRRSLVALNGHVIRNTRIQWPNSGSLASETSNSERKESTSHSLRSPLAFRSVCIQRYPATNTRTRDSFGAHHTRPALPPIRCISALPPLYSGPCSLCQQFAPGYGGRRGRGLQYRSPTQLSVSRPVGSQACR